MLFRVERPSLVAIELAQFRQHAPRGLCRSLVLLGWHSPLGINRLRPAKRSVERQTHDVPDFGGRRAEAGPRIERAEQVYALASALHSFYMSIIHNAQIKKSISILMECHVPKRPSKSPPEKYSGPPLVDAILMAADRVGSDGRGRDGIVGYFRSLAVEHPRSFARLLATVLDHQLEHPPAEAPAPKQPMTEEEFFKALENRGIPTVNIRPLFARKNSRAC